MANRSFLDYQTKEDFTTQASQPASGNDKREEYKTVCTNVVAMCPYCLLDQKCDNKIRMWEAATLLIIIKSSSHLSLPSAWYLFICLFLWLQNNLRSQAPRMACDVRSAHRENLSVPRKTAHHSYNISM